MILVYPCFTGRFFHGLAYTGWLYWSHLKAWKGAKSNHFCAQILLNINEASLVSSLVSILLIKILRCFRMSPSWYSLLGHLFPRLCEFENLLLRCRRSFTDSICSMGGFLGRFSRCRFDHASWCDQNSSSRRGDEKIWNFLPFSPKSELLNNVKIFLNFFCFFCRNLSFQVMSIFF